VESFAGIRGLSEGIVIEARCDPSGGE